MARPLRTLALPVAAALVAVLASSCSSSPSAAPPAAPAATSGPASSARSEATTGRTERSTTTESSTDDTSDSTDSTDDTSDTTSDDTTGATPAGACDLLRQADVEEAFGQPVEAGTQDSSECWWATDTDLKNVNLQIDTDADLDTWRKGYQNSSWEPVDFGDEGYAGKVLDSIVFRVGDTTYELTVSYSTSGDAEAAVQALAEKAASRV